MTNSDNAHVPEQPPTLGPEIRPTEANERIVEEGIYARFLAEKGEGIHHVAVATPNFDETC